MNKKHKHCELIKQWADGAEIEFKSKVDDEWKVMETPLWLNESEYRIKPEPKSDVVKYGQVYLVEDLQIIDNLRVKFFDFNYTQLGHHNLKLTFDGETGELKSAEVLK